MKISDYIAQYESKHDEGARIAARLLDIGQDRRASAILSCGTYTRGTECPECGAFHVYSTSLCRDRLCPVCAWKSSRRLFYRAVAAIQMLELEYSHRYMHCVLTLQHAKGDCLRDLLNVLTRAYGRFRRFSAMKSVDGSLRSIEITHGEHGFHPHIHAILTMPRTAAHITEYAVRDAWRRALDSEYSPQVNLTEAYSGDAADDVLSAVAEACKYALKPGMLPELDDADLREFIDAVRGVRMVSSDGAVKRYLQVATMQPPQKSGECPECGAHRWQRHVALIYDYETGSLNEGAPL